MLAKKSYCNHVNLIIIFFITTYKPAKCQINAIFMIEEGAIIAQTTAYTFMGFFESCLRTTMKSQQFAVDNLQKFILHPPRTTIGLLPKFTSNRKFFANLIGTTGFKEMVQKDEEQLRVQYIHKLKYCDETTMDPRALIDFYEKEVDQSKM